MKQEANVHAEEDKKKKGQAEVKNQTESVIFQMDKLLKEAGDKVPAEQKQELEVKLNELKQLKDTDQYDALKAKLEEVNQLAQKLGAAMYQQSAQSQPEQPASEQKANTDNKKDEGPIEGEFTEKKN